MAQKQYTTYQNDILSFELRDSMLGIIKSGRYIGYNAMTEYQAQSGLNVFCRISHSGGISKYDQSNPPVLEAIRGIAVTTQGSIIAEDGNVDVTVTLHTGGSSGKWHILYMEHIYLGVAGANPATYGIQSGTNGGGIPTLSNATRRSIIGYIYEAVGATNFSGLTYHPAQSESRYGDSDLAKKLWGEIAAKLLDTSTSGALGTIPSSGIIGGRSYTEENFITNFNSLTKSLDDLDISLNDVNDDLILTKDRRIDQWASAVDGTSRNATTSYPGLLRKLSNVASEFMNGLGNWAVPAGARFVMRTGSFTTDIEFNDASSLENQVNFASVGGCPSDADVLVIQFLLKSKSTLPAATLVNAFFRRTLSDGRSAEINLQNLGGAAQSVTLYGQFTIPCDSTQKFYANLTSVTYLDYLRLTLVGWQTYQ